MKKVLTIVMVIIVVFVAGCANYANEFDLDAILIEDNGQLSVQDDLIYKNSISGKPQYFLEDSVQKEKRIDLNNVECELKYKDSLYYPIGCMTVDRYIVNGDEDKTILIDRSGNIKAILYSYTTLDIERTASPQEVLEPLKAELLKIFDITHYKNINLPEANQSVSGFGVYSYLFYNKIGDYMTDYFKVAVSSDGGVSGIFITDVSLDGVAVDINKEKESSAIEAKLREIYSSHYTQYQSYEMSFTPGIVNYNEQVYVRYFLSAKYLHTKHGEMRSFTHTILIPVDDISN